MLSINVNVLLFVKCLLAKKSLGEAAVSQKPLYWDPGSILDPGYCM